MIKQSIQSRGLVLVALISLGTVGLHGCSDESQSDEESAAGLAAESATSTAVKAQPVGGLMGEWVLTALDSKPPPSLPNEVSLKLNHDGWVAGSAGINRFSTKVKVTDGQQGRINFGPASLSRKAGRPEAMEFEQTFMKRLGAVRTYVVDGDTLRMYAGDNEALTFKRS